LALCNGWTTGVEKAQNLLIAMEGASTETVRGLTADKDEDYDLICARARDVVFVDSGDVTPITTRVTHLRLRHGNVTLKHPFYFYDQRAFSSQC